MLRRIAWVVLSGTIAAGTVSVAAHHSVGAIYRLDEQITIDGVLTRIVYRNPHSSLEVEAPDRSGRMRVWAVECASPNELHRQSFTDGRLKPGERVIITGDAARDAAQWRMRLRSLVRPSDGWQWTEPARSGVGQRGPTSGAPSPGEGPRSKQ